MSNPTRTEFYPPLESINFDYQPPSRGQIERMSRMELHEVCWAMVPKGMEFRSWQDHIGVVTDRDGPHFEGKSLALDLWQFWQSVSLLAAMTLPERIEMYERAGADWCPIYARDGVPKVRRIQFYSRPTPTTIPRESDLDNLAARPSELKTYDVLDITDNGIRRKGVDLREPERARLDEWYEWPGANRGPYKLRREYRGAGVSTHHAYLDI